MYNEKYFYELRGVDKCKTSLSNRFPTAIQLLKRVVF